MGHAKFSELLGKTIIRIDGMVKDSDTIVFYCQDGSSYGMYHIQECCESVYIEDVVGESFDLLGSPILLAEEVTQDDPENYECGMWTFYKLATVHGYVDIRWYGESNGYYSVSVDFRKTA